MMSIARADQTNALEFGSGLQGRIYTSLINLDKHKCQLPQFIWNGFQHSKNTQKTLSTLFYIFTVAMGSIH